MSRPSYPKSPHFQLVPIGKAAAILGVSAGRLRSWDHSGTLRAKRDKKTGYRLYRITDLERFAVKHELKRPRLVLKFD